MNLLDLMGKFCSYLFYLFLADGLNQVAGDLLKLVALPDGVGDSALIDLLEVISVIGGL